MWGAYCWLLWLVLVGDWAAFPEFPHDWLKLWLDWDIPKPYGPQPWHLKHWRDLGSLLLASHLVLVTWLFFPWFLLIVVPVPWFVGELWSRAVSPRLVQPLWDLGQPAVSLSVCPLPLPLSLGLFGALAGLPPCPGQGGHQFCDLLPQFCGALSRVSGLNSPSPYLILDVLILTFHLECNNH